MTHELKAKELVEKFLPFLNDYSTYSRPNEPLQIAVDEGMKTGRAIRCAMICVDEIINNQPPSPEIDYQKEYWQSVKTEIEKLSTK